MLGIDLTRKESILYLLVFVYQRPKFDSDKRWFLTRIFDFDVIGSGLYKFGGCVCSCEQNGELIAIQKLYCFTG